MNTKCLINSTFYQKILNERSCGMYILGDRGRKIKSLRPFSTIQRAKARMGDRNLYILSISAVRRPKPKNE